MKNVFKWLSFRLSHKQPEYQSYAEFLRKWEMREAPCSECARELERDTDTSIPEDDGYVAYDTSYTPEADEELARELQIRPCPRCGASVPWECACYTAGSEEAHV